MLPNALRDPEAPPDTAAMDASLGAAAPYMRDLLLLTAGWEQEWKFHGRKYGWKLRVHDGDKSLLEITVGEGALLANVAVRDSERNALMADPIVGPLVQAAASTKGSYGLKVEVRDPATFGLVEAVVRHIMDQRMGAGDAEDGAQG